MVSIFMGVSLCLVVGENEVWRVEFCSVSRLGVALQEFSGREDSDSSPRVHRPQMLVAADNYLGLGVECKFQKSVVCWVNAIRHGCGRFDELTCACQREKEFTAAFSRKVTVEFLARNDLT